MANAIAERMAFVAPLERIEIRESANGEDFTLTGHAAVFERWSEDLWTFAGTFREKIARGAFADVLASKPDVRLLFNHDGMALARTKSNTLELTEDDTGLRVWARLSPDMQLARDLRVAMQRGDIDQMSFAFTIAEDSWHEDHDTEEVERTIERVDELFDVSVVTFPAYPDTDAAMRELRSAAQAGLITLPEDPAARAETDPAGTESAPEAAKAETDPSGSDLRDVDAPAETDPAVGGSEALDDLRQRSREGAREAREGYLRLLKEMTK